MESTTRDRPGSDEGLQPPPRDQPRDQPRNQPRDQPRNQPRNQPRDQPRTPSRGWRSRGRTWWRGLARGDRRAALVLLFLGLLGLLLFFGQHPVDASERSEWQGPRISSDGRYYYHSLRSLVLDGDLDLSNEYRDHHNFYGFGPSRTGRPRNPFGIGPALAWLPGFVVGHGIAALGDGPADGYTLAEQAGALIISFLAGLATLGLTYAYARRHFAPGPALLGTLVAGLGGPLLWYAVYEPSMPHALAACTTTLFLVVALPLRRPTLRRHLQLGLLAGLAMLMRPQHGVLLAVPLVELLLHAVQVRPSPRGLLRLAAWGVAGLGLALLVFTPQLLAWRAIYGEAWVVPQGTQFLRWGESMWSEVLFSSRNGLLSSHPALWFSVIGFLAWARKHRADALVLGLLLVSQVYINGAAWDWWGGGAYGGRRMLGSSLLYAVGLSACLAPLMVGGPRRRWIASAVTATLVAAILVPQWLVLAATQRKEIAMDDPTPIAHQVEVALGPRLRRMHAHIGNPFAFPANAIFALRHGVPLSRYDHAVGPYLLSERVSTTNPSRPVLETAMARLTPPEGERHAGRGLEPTERGLRLEGEGTLLVPLNRPGGLTLQIYVRGETPSPLTLRFGDGPTQPCQLEPPLAKCTMQIDASWVRRGINPLVITAEPPVTLTHLILTEGDDWPAPWVKDAP